MCSNCDPDDPPVTHALCDKCNKSVRLRDMVYVELTPRSFWYPGDGEMWCADCREHEQTEAEIRAEIKACGGYENWKAL